MIVSGRTNNSCFKYGLESFDSLTLFPYIMLVQKNPSSVIVILKRVGIAEESARHKQSQA